MNVKKLLSGSGAITGYIIGIIALLIGVFSINGKIEFEWKWIILIVVIIIFIITASIISFFNCKKEMDESKRFQVNSYDTSDEKDYLYIDLTNLFRFEAFVSIYIVIDGISKRMGFGFVSNVTDTYVEIEVVNIFNYSDKFEQAKNNNKKVLDRMYVMPTVFTENIDCIYNSMIERRGNHG